MLGWLAAAAAPILIHLWNRRKYKETPWAAVEFLLSAVRRRARRIQFMQWLLLAIRTLIILLVVTACAQPFLESAGLKFTPGERTHRLFVIDGSYSMDFRPTDRSRFVRAKELVRDIVEQSSQGDGFTLLLMASPPRSIVATPALEAADFLQELQTLALTHGGADLPATLAAVRQTLKRARDQQPDLQHEEVYFLTDLGRTTWAPDFPNEEAAGEFRASLEELAAQTPLVVFDLGETDGENVAVTRLETPDRIVTWRQEVTLEATLRNFGARASSSQFVELWVDEARIQQSQLELPAGGEESVLFTHRFETPGQHVVAVRLGGDLLDVDNHRWLSLPVRDHLQVLCIGGKRGATRYLLDALAPGGEEKSLVQPQVAPESALVELDLTQFDCIFFANVGQFTPGEAKLLEAYLKQGGGLVFFMGDRVLPDRYNAVLAGGDPAAPRILPAKIENLVDEARYRFDPGDYEHPIISAFRGNERAGLLSTPIYRYYRLAVPDIWRDSRVALRFEGGDPAIVEAPRYRGRSILVATAASLSSVNPATRSPWTTMPTWPSFLPIVQELLATAAGSQWEQYNLQVGEPLAGALPNFASPGGILVDPPDEEEDARAASVVSDLDQASWTFEQTQRSGIYRVRLGSSSQAVQKFAVNVDTRESDLRKIDPAELPSAFSVRTTYENLDQQPSAQISRRSGLHRLLLFAALVLMFAEQYLARLMARGL